MLVQLLGRPRGAAPSVAPSKARGQLVDALLALDGYPGVCGRTRFNQTGEAERELKTLTIRNHRIAPFVASSGRRAGR